MAGIRGIDGCPEGGETLLDIGILEVDSQDLRCKVRARQDAGDSERTVGVE